MAGIHSTLRYAPAACLQRREKTGVLQDLELKSPSAIGTPKPCPARSLTSSFALPKVVLVGLFLCSSAG
jgi:hypothetical protein